MADLRKTFMFEGKQYFVRGKTQKELAAKIDKRKIELALNRKKNKIDKTTLVKDWIPRYLETYREPNVSAKEYKQLESYFRLYITPVIGEMVVNDVLPIHCATILNAMTDKTNKYIKKVAYALKDMLEKAVDNDMAETNAAAKVTRPKGKKDGSHRALTPYERDIFEQACEISKYGLRGLYMLYTGAMPDETVKLMGQHIDLKNHRIFIDGTKTEYRSRWVPMDDILFEKFSAVTLTPFQSVFTNAYGKPLTKTNISRQWAAIKKEMHILMGGKVDYGEHRRVVPPYAVAPDLTQYCLRHTFATDCRDAGIDITVTMEYMGHSTTKMLEEIYIHKTERSFIDSSAKLNAYRKSLKGENTNSKNKNHVKNMPKRLKSLEIQP